MARNRLSAQNTGKRRASGKGAARHRNGQGNPVQPARARIEWAPQAYQDYGRWREVAPPIADRIDTLIADILRSPFSGIGKPEPLKHKLAGCWSRRINQEHRLVYRWGGGRLSILSCRYHY